MTTICSKCGLQLEEKENETFQLCSPCGRFTPKGAHSYISKENTLKGGSGKMSKQNEAEKKEEATTTTESKVPKAKLVRELLAKEKPINEIAQEVGVKLAYVLAVQKKDAAKK